MNNLGKLTASEGMCTVEAGSHIGSDPIAGFEPASPGKRNGSDQCVADQRPTIDMNQCLAALRGVRVSPYRHAT